ncbi:hypothetical protein EV174_002248 [Coemansia sp. RSA 2320]|nr:hypothetical protein EV174_002248 [Coemansia sp. RSA 2320]
MPRDCTCSLHVSRIGKGVKVSDLKAVFEEFGKIKDVYIPLDFYTKESRGFGYVEFYEREDAEAAYDRRRDILVRRKPVTVEFARGQRKSSREMRVTDGYPPQTSLAESPAPFWREPSSSSDRDRGKRSSKRSRSRSSSHSRSRSRSHSEVRGKSHSASPAQPRSQPDSEGRTPSPRRRDFSDDDAAAEGGDEPGAVDETAHAMDVSPSQG